MELTEAERLAPSERLAQNLDHYKDLIGEPSALDEQETSCLRRAVSLAGFCVEQTHLQVQRAYDALPEGASISTRYSLMTALRWLNSCLAEVKDATFLVDGYHAAMVLRQQDEADAAEDLELTEHAA